MFADFRCFVDVPELRKGPLELSEEEARHLAQVRRAEAGGSVTVLNGRGQSALAEIAVLSKRAVSLELLEICSHPAPAPEITLCIGGLKQAAWDELLRHAVELGLNRLVWVGSDHAVADVKAGRAENKLRRWRERLIQACKQSANPWLPEISVLDSVEQTLREAPAVRRLVASLHGNRRGAGELLDSGESLQIWVGPEGDFSTREYEALEQAGTIPVTLGPRILRAETAALALLARIRL